MDVRLTPAGPGWIAARALASGLAVTALAGCAAAPEVVGWIEGSRDHPWAPVLVVAVFVASGFVAAPLSAVMVPTIVVLGPLHGSLWTLVGATASGALFFWLGARGSALAGRLGARPALGDRVTRLLEGNGILAVALARNLPLAPYPIVNLALGASPLRLPDFLVGNLLGLLPWVALYAAAGAELRSLLASPSPRSLVVAGIAVAGVVVVAVAAGRLATRFLAPPRPQAEPPAD